MGRRAKAEPVAEYEEEQGTEAANDVLSGGWKVGLYGASLIPFGSWFVVFGSSILYYAWRKEFPNKAAQINKHGWLAWLLGLVLWGGIWFLARPGVSGIAQQQTAADEDAPVAAPRRDYAPRETVADRMERISQKVAADAVERYLIAKRQGDKLQTCVQAGMVSASFLQAKDEYEYTKWKAIEKADCRAAGMPQP
jgi:hypothetical protein